MSRFAKSNHQTKMQMASVIDGGCDGLTFDILDFLGTGSASEPEIAFMLSGAKAKMIKIRELTAESKPIGVQAILPVNTTAVAPGNGIANLPYLPTTHYGWFIYLGGFGIPCVNKPVMGEVDSAQVYALAGDSVWAIPDGPLKKMLETAVVLLDADAARIVVERGCGELIGVKKIDRYNREESIFSIEESVNYISNEIPERASVNLPERNFFINSYELSNIAKPKTKIKDCFLNDMGPGSVIYRNATDGKDLILPYTVPSIDLFPYGWTRKYWLNRWLSELCGSFPMPQLVNGTWVYISAHAKGMQKTIFLANQMYEVYQELKIRLPEDFACLNWRMEIHSRDKVGTVKKTDEILTVATEFVGNDWIILVGTL